MKENEIVISPIINEKLLATAKRLPNEGILKRSDEQLIYLDIDNRFINELCPLLEDEEVEKPDYFFTGMGAHISVIYPNEMFDPKVKLDQIFHFQIEDLFRAETDSAIYFALTVHSPDLMKVRYANHLAKQLNLNGLIVDMHTTIGKITKKI